MYADNLKNIKTKKELKAQKALGLVPQDCELHRCGKCKKKTPQIVVSTGAPSNMSLIYLLYNRFEDRKCLVCGSNNQRRFNDRVKI